MASILTKQQIEHLLHVYSTEGGNEARKLAPEYGIKPVYVGKLCKVHGVKALQRPNKQKMKAKLRGHLDPRWEWAKAIGPIIA